MCTVTGLCSLGCEWNVGELALSSVLAEEQYTFVV